jgi:hypothetical protein
MTTDDNTAASLADIALDAACAAVQDALGVTDGGFAAHHFSGEEGDAIRAILRRYIAAENAFNVEA